MFTFGRRDSGRSLWIHSIVGLSYIAKILTGWMGFPLDFQWIVFLFFIFMYWCISWVDGYIGRDAAGTCLLRGGEGGGHLGVSCVANHSNKLLSNAFRLKTTIIRYFVARSVTLRPHHHTEKKRSKPKGPRE